MRFARARDAGLSEVGHREFVMKKAGLLVLAVLLGVLSSAAQARKPPPAALEADDYVNKEIPEAANVWHCWYNGAASIRCRLGELADPAAGKAAAVAEIDSRLPDFVRKVWQKAADLADQIVNIPLHAIPFDMAMTGQLAEAVMCGGATQPCGVVFARSQALLADAVRRRDAQLAARRFGRLALAD